MKRFLMTNLLLILAGGVITPTAIAQGTDHSSATDLNGDGVISVQEMRLHYLDYSSN